MAPPPHLNTGEMSDPAPVHADILLAKLCPKQRIWLEVHCTKGIGKDHTKWSPVATASYRMLPTVEITGRIEGTEAEALRDVDPEVFDVRDGVAVVKDLRKCRLTRECIRTPRWRDQIKLGRNLRHFLFSVETCVSPSDACACDRRA